MQALKRATLYIIILAGTLLIIITLLSLIYDVRYWYLKALDFPRVQFLIGLLVCLVIFFAVNRSWKITSVIFLFGLLSGIVIQARFILPYTPLVSEAVETIAPGSIKKERSFSLLVANVWMENRQTDAFLNLVHASDPDIVLAMETTNWWLSRLTQLHERYPYKILYPLDNTYGMALYSKLPLENSSVKFLSHEKVPSFHAVVRLQDGSPFVLHAVHPVPPKPSPYPDNVGEQEVALLKVGKMVSKRELPTLVAGDFNDVAWSKTNRLFGTESSLKDLRIGRGLFNTFDATSAFLRWPIDHIYTSDEFRVISLARLPEFGSDHFPILVKLTLLDSPN